MSLTIDDLFASPDHYLHSFEGDAALFVPMDRAAYHRSIFLDGRISPAADGAMRLPFGTLAGKGGRPAATAWDLPRRALRIDLARQGARPAVDQSGAARAARASPACAHSRCRAAGGDADDAVEALSRRHADDRQGQRPGQFPAARPGRLGSECAGDLPAPRPSRLSPRHPAQRQASRLGCAT